MPKKANTPVCPNCGAPVPAVLTFGNMVKCEYCGSYVNISEFIRSKAPPAPTPAPPRPVQRQPRPSEQRPKVMYKPEDYIGYSKKRKLSDEDIIAIIEVVVALFLAFVFPGWLRGCL